MGAMGEMTHAGMADPFTARALCEWLMLIVLLPAFGLAMFAAFVLPQPSQAQPPVRLWSWLRAMALAALVLAPFQFATAVASMAGTGIGQALVLMPEVMRGTYFGQVWIVSAPLFVALAAAVWIPGRSRRRAQLAAAIAASLLALRATASHAIDYGAVAILSYFAHEAAAGMWAGALVGLWLTAGPAARARPGDELIVGRVSRTCGWCVAALAITGAYIAYRGLGLSLDHLLYSAYGRMLIAKLAVFAILVMTGAYNRYWLVAQFHAAPARNALMQSVRVECALITGVLLLAALLANTPPAH